MKIFLWLVFANLLLLPSAFAGSYQRPIDNFAEPFHPEAFIQFSPDIDGESLVFLANSQGNPQKQPYLSIAGVENLSHGMEYHQGHFYCMETLGTGQYPEWNREFWRYEGKKGTRLLTGKLEGPFLVSSDEAYIALVNTVSLGGTKFDDRLDILDAKDGKLLKTFSGRDIGLKILSDDYCAINLVGFYNGELWICDGEDEEEPIFNFVEIKAGTWKTALYPCAKGIDRDYGFNPYNCVLVFDDYPFFADAGDDEKFHETKTAVHLNVYDVRTGKIILVDTGIARRFDEKWINKDTLEYKDPHGEGLIQKKFGLAEN